jgi:hypothetical protein
MGKMSAQPVAPAGADPLDPQHILAELPASERDFFLGQYREAAEEAREPAGWAHLHRMLRLWAYRAEALKHPGFQEAERAALDGTSRGMLLEDAIQLREQGDLDAYIAQHFGG